MSILFPDQERSDTEVPRHGEGHYEYLQRSARPEATKIRSVLDTWLSNYPRSEQPELVLRLQADGQDFLSSFFELYLHELLIRSNCFVQVHPNLGTESSAKSDFLVKDDAGREFYLEASVVSGKTDEEKGQDRSKNRVYDLIEGLEPPDFFVGVQIVRSASKTLRKKDLLNSLDEWLKSLVWEEVISGSHEDWPEHEYLADGWEIEFYAIPKLAEARGKAGVRPIGSMMDVRFADRRDPVRKRIISKGRHYKGPDIPFIVAVNCMDFRTINGSREPISEALFGKEQMLIYKTEKGPIPATKRKMDGVWTTGSGPRYTRISGVLFGFALDPWNMAFQDLLLVANPSAKNPINEILSPLQRVVTELDGNALRSRFVAGTHPRQILGLPKGWPE